MDLIINTACGKVNGSVKNGIYSWKGIPFAAPPIGELRFKAPERHKGWEGVLNTTKFGPVCPQMLKFQKETENEDCLYLNVYTNGTEEKKPVMIFIHGGAFKGGSGSQYLYEGSTFAKKGILMVTINYRHGAMGMFNFSFLDKEFATNIALRDQLFALQWVYENIENFGGNPEDITIFGQSAGAISVISLLNIPSAKKYIKKAIALSPFPEMINSAERSEKIARGFLEFLGLKEEDKDILQMMEGKELTIQANKYIALNERKMGLDLLMPVTDGDFFPDMPLRNMKSGNSHHVPLIIGVTNNEVDLLFNIKLTKDMAIKEIEFMLEDEKEIKEELIEAYGELNLMSCYGKMGRDWLLRIPSEWYAREHSKREKVWLYRFDYESLLLKITGLHSVHALDLIFVFRNFNNLVGKAIFALTPFRKKALQLAERIQDDYISFVKTGVASWDTFDKDSSVKVYNGNSDTVEKDADSSDAIRRVWEKTRHYKEI